MENILKTLANRFECLVAVTSFSLLGEGEDRVQCNSERPKH